MIVSTSVDGSVRAVIDLRRLGDVDAARGELVVKVGGDPQARHSRNKLAIAKRKRKLNRCRA
jgi:hypothetical protein